MSLLTPGFGELRSAAAGCHKRWSCQGRQFAGSSASRPVPLRSQVILDRNDTIVLFPTTGSPIGSRASGPGSSAPVRMMIDAPACRMVHGNPEIRENGPTGSPPEAIDAEEGPIIPADREVLGAGSPGRTSPPTTCTPPPFQGLRPNHAARFLPENADYDQEGALSADPIDVLIFTGCPITCQCRSCRHVHRTGVRVGARREPS